MLEVKDQVVYELEKNNAGSLKLFGEVTSMGKYGFISGTNGDTHIPVSEIPKCKEKKIRYSDLVTYYKKPPNGGKSSLAVNISKL